MNVKLEMDKKWDEISTIKKEREPLFEDFDNNKDRISELYYEIEFKQLEYLFLKRQQLDELALTTINPDSVTAIQKVNETCIGISQNNLVEKGFEARLKSEGLI